MPERTSTKRSILLKGHKTSGTAVEAYATQMVGEFVTGLTFRTDKLIKFCLHGLHLVDQQEPEQIIAHHDQEASR
jgi:hypothetical protein